MERRGHYIVFEGINGSGKGLQLQQVTEWVYDHSRHNIILRLREPNLLDAHGARAREVLQTSSDPYAGARECLAYFAKNRATSSTLIRDVLRFPHTWVLGDRYYHSTFAFQGAQGIPVEEIIAAHDALPIEKPDLTIIFDLPASVAAERLSRTRTPDQRRKFDRDAIFLEQVREQYLALENALRGWDDHIVYVRADQSPDAVFADTTRVLRERFPDLT